jgi:hypothetical protein
MASDKVVREELIALLDGGNAHMGFDEVIADFPVEHINGKPLNNPYSFWHFLEHMRIAQWDILEFIRNPRHVSPQYSQGYHRRPEEITDEKGWEKSAAAIRADLEALKEIVRDPKVDLFAEIPHAPGYTVFREILLAADHIAYHIGELAMMRQVMDNWPAGRKYLTGKPD